MILSVSVSQSHWSSHSRIPWTSFPVSIPTPPLFSLELLRTSYIATRKIFWTFSLVSHTLALRRLDPRSFSYSLHPQLRNAPGICSCTLEPMSIPPNIVLLMVYNKSHCVWCSFPPRSLPSIFLCASAQFAKLLGTLLHWWLWPSHVSVLDSIVTLKNQTCCRILVQSLDSPPLTSRHGSSWSLRGPAQKHLHPRT